MDLTRYSGIKISSKRGLKGGGSRAEIDLELDFVYMVELRKAGATWEEITELINRERPYYTTVKMNKNLYNKQVRLALISEDTKQAAQDIKDDILEEYEWVYSQAVGKWNELKDVQFQDEISGLVGENTEINDDGEEVVKKKYSKKKVGLVEQHQSKYLDIALKALDGKGRLTGANIQAAEEMSLIEILRNKVLDDGGYAQSIVMTSEEEVIRTYLPSGVELQIIRDVGEEE